MTRVSGVNLYVYKTATSYFIKALGHLGRWLEIAYFTASRFVLKRVELQPPRLWGWLLHLFSPRS